MKTLAENTLFKKLTSTFDRSSDQINQLLESDSELLKLDNGSVLAITTDCIVEEIETGLYEDPYMIGWMTVTVNMSDIAAVGARPLGLLLQENLPHNYPDDNLKLLQKGISDACKAHGTYVVGGDTNYGLGFQMGGTAVGIIEDQKIITRKGCNTGDHLFISGKMGVGNAFGLNKLFPGHNELEISYQPVARPTYGQIVRKYGSCCIDSSDGFFPAICNLMEINQKGFELFSSFNDLCANITVELSKKYELPKWIFLAGPHGEYELVFTIPEAQIQSFLKSASEVNWHPIPIGTVEPETSFSIPVNKSQKIIDPFEIGNLFTECEGNLEKYLQRLLKINAQWQNPN